jgi:phosphoglycerate dehydrogenase-like enzyme
MHSTSPTTPILFAADPVIAAPLIDALRRQAPDLPLVPYSRSLDEATLAAVEVVIGWRFPPGVAGRLTSLRWVFAMAAGVDKLLVPDLAPQVVVSRMVDPGQALGIAQYVAAMVLRHVRGQPRYDAQQLVRDWTRHPMGAVRSKVVVLGYGAIGREIGRVLAAIGFDVQPWQRSSGPLHAALADASIVVNALALTPQTEGILDAAAFAAMPKGAYLVNIARGQHVVEPDLIAAITAGHLAGATLDVQATEPMTPDDPLWTTPGITITPHVAGQSSPDVVAAQFLAGLQALREGAALPNVVDRGRGY